MPGGMLLGVDAAAARGGGGPFDPSSISGLKLWLKADSESYADGASVTSWHDRSGNGNDAIPGVAPTFKTGIVNGLPAVRFDGASNYLAAPVALAQPFTLFIVLQGTGRAFDSDIAQNANRAIFAVKYSGNAFLVYADAVVTGGSYAGATWRYVTVEFNGSSSGLWDGGASQSLSGNPGASGTVSRVLLGSDALADYYAGDLAEMLLFGSALGSTDRGNVEGYLAAKYNL